MAHFNFVITQNAKWRHAGFYIDCHWMTVPENILLQKSTACSAVANRQVENFPYSHPHSIAFFHCFFPIPNFLFPVFPFNPARGLGRALLMDLRQVRPSVAV